LGRLQPSNRTIIGVALLLFSAVLVGFGIHHLVRTGSCSSTGYSSYGPVPHCPTGTAWWILLLIGGIFGTIVGGLIAASGAILIVPAVFTAIGAGAFTVGFDSAASSGTKTFGLIFGGCFLAFGLIPLLYIAARGLRNLGGAPPGYATSAAPPATTLPTASSSVFEGPEPASPFGEPSKPDAILGAYAAGTGTRPAPAPSAPLSFSSPAPSASSSSTPDAIDKLAKLAELRDRGALTEDEFNREKAKLLADI
jgi:hypothetical protein